MALWEVNGELVYSDGALSIQNPSGSIFAKRFRYVVPRSNIGIGAIIKSPISDQTYHVPSWTPVHPKTTLEDIMIEEKPFAELFEEPKSWQFESSSGGKTYNVKQKKDGSFYCDCWGYIAHRKCKHIEKTKEMVSE